MTAPRLHAAGLPGEWEQLAEKARALLYRYSVVPLRCEYISPNAESITGIPAAEFYRDPRRGLAGIHPDDRAHFEALLDDPADAPALGTVRWKHPDGRVVWTEHRCVALRDARGNVIGMVGVAHDVTDLIVAGRAGTDSALSAGELRALSVRLQQMREEERASLARELHDELGQLLTSLKLDFARIIKTLCAERPTLALADQLQSAVGNVDLSIETVRRIATELRPATLDHLGLETAIREEAQRLTLRTGLRVRVFARIDGAVNGEQATAAFRVCQEALTNVVRHAAASKVTITVTADQQVLMLTVKDNGRGFDVDRQDLRVSLGLLGMRERARALGGEVQVVSRPGRGTSLLLLIPLGEREART